MDGWGVDWMQMVLSHVDPLTEQQIVAVYGLQQSAVQTEEALSQGLDALYQSLSDTVVSDALTCCTTPNVSNYMGQMGLAVHKLSTLEGFVRQVTFPHHHYHRSIISLHFMSL